MSFFKAIQDFFQMLFSSSTPEHKKQKELKKIQQALRSANPPLFKNGQILPVFADSMLSFWRFLSPVRDILLATIGNDDTKIAGKYQDFLFESVLTADQREQCQSFSYEWRQRSVIASDNPDGALLDFENAFTRYLKLFEQPEFAEIDRQMQRLFVVLDVCKYNFADFFILFDAAFSLGSDSADPNFLPVPPKQMLNELSDFYFVAHRFVLDDRVASIIALLREKLEKAEFTDVQRQKIIKTYANIDSYLKLNISNSLMLNILRLAAEDPLFTPRKDESRSSRLQSYLTRCSDRYSVDTERIRRSIQENSVLQSVKDLFPDIELVQISGYTEEFNELIEQNTPFSFKWIKPLKIIRTYFSQFFDESFAAMMNVVTLECFFSDKAFEQRLISSFSFSSTIENRFTEFEQLFEQEQPFDEAVLKAIIEESAHDPDAAEKKAGQTIDAINHYAQDFMQNELTKFERFAQSLNELINDSKRTTPDLVANIRTVLMGKQVDIISEMAKKLESSALFFSIMKNFAVVHGI